jgi:hypothetical protein
MSKEALKKFIIDLSKSPKKRNKFKENPEGQLERLLLSAEERQALLNVLNARNHFIDAQKKLEELQGAPLPVDDAIIDRLQPIRRRPVWQGLKKTAKKKMAKKK